MSPCYRWQTHSVSLTLAYWQKEIFRDALWNILPRAPLSGLSSDLWSPLSQEMFSGSQFGVASEDSRSTKAWQGKKSLLCSHCWEAGVFVWLFIIAKECPLGDIMRNTFIGSRWENQRQSGQKMKQNKTDENKTKMWSQGPSQSKMEFKAITQLTQQQN